MFRTAFSDLVNLVYPRVCCACNAVLVQQEQFLCTACLYYMPKTNFHKNHNNSLSQLFWGRIKFEAATALYYFERGSKSRKILHQVKYKGKKKLARYLGIIYGEELSKHEIFIDSDYVVPVPLHPSREKKRGFNQSDWFAGGLAYSLDKTVMRDNLVRTGRTESQTNKSRIDRWENVKDSFKLKYPEKINDKHILLVDDVVTTGATIESCASVLLSQPGVRVSIIAIAYA